MAEIGKLIHGGDYNPEQWLDRPDILFEDVRMMKEAGINCVTLGVFSWSFYEREEGSFDFKWLKDIVDRLYENGIYFILATPSGARPAWLDAGYPDAMRVNDLKIRNHHGVRHNHCMTSRNYREKVRIIDRKLSEEFGKHPGFVMFHISNEYGGACFCDACADRFRAYLYDRFNGDIDALNKAWWTSFWSHTYTSFDQIEPPYSNGERSIMGLNLEWNRFTTYNTVDFMKEEIRAVREFTPDAEVTTNFMSMYGGLDYHVMAKELDVISWDSYPRFCNDHETLYETMAETAFSHSMMRSMKKDRPFMLMESAPGLVNWHEYNKLKRPGVHRLACMQAVACGSDSVQYFQWRKGRGSFEQYHGAVVDHLGTSDTRIFKEVKEVSELLDNIGEVAGSVVKSETAILFDWDNRWAINDMKGLSAKTKKYEKTCIDLYKDLLKLGTEADVIPVTENFEDYKVVFASMLYMLKPGVSVKLSEYVKQGGVLVATYLTGYVDENTLCYLGGFPGDGLKELVGVISEEIDTLYPTDRNGVRFADGTVLEVKDYAEILRVTDAEVLARYTDDFYKEQPAVTKKEYGKGTAYYIAARCTGDKRQEQLKKLLETYGVMTMAIPEGVEHHQRRSREAYYDFYLNHNKGNVVIDGIDGFDLIEKERKTGRLDLSGYGVAVIKRQV